VYLILSMSACSHLRRSPRELRFNGEPTQVQQKSEEMQPD